MARHYHVAAASVALDCSAKWLDNLLSRRDIPGVARERQGIARRLSSDALLRLAVVRILVRDLEMAIPMAISLANRLCDEGEGRHMLPSGLAIQLDLARLRRELELRLFAADVSVPPRRGRPPLRASTQPPRSSS